MLHLKSSSFVISLLLLFSKAASAGELSGLGEPCNGVFRNNECAEGLTCAKATGFRGRCLPLECYNKALQKFNQEFDLTTYQENIFDQANLSTDDLRTLVENAGSGERFRPSETLNELSEAMANNPVPSSNLQQDINNCDARYTQDRETTSPNTLYIGVHVEGGPIIDGSFSFYEIQDNNLDPPTKQQIIRACGGAGLGIGIEVSALIGIAFTSDVENLRGTSIIISDWDVGLAFMGGAAFGSFLDQTLFLEFTIGLGVGFEAMGISGCFSWEQRDIAPAPTTSSPSVSASPSSLGPTMTPTSAPTMTATNAPSAPPSTCAESETTVELSMTALITFSYIGVETEPTAAELQSVVDGTQEFFSDTLAAEYPDSFQSFVIDTSDQTVTPPSWTLDFTATLTFVACNAPTATEINLFLDNDVDYNANLPPYVRPASGEPSNDTTSNIFGAAYTSGEVTGP